MLDAATSAQVMTRLEAVFTHIQDERMQDVPIMNNDLRVEAVDFRRYEDCWLGVMITPWFMNLMLLPAEDDDWSELQELTEHQRVFPSGKYTFIAGYEADVGTYQSCSLFSPMFEFADQVAAVDTAHAVMEALMDPENRDEGDIDQDRIEAIWNGEEQLTEEELANVLPTQTADDADGEAAIQTASVETDTNNSPPPPPKKRTSLKERAQRPMNRRELLRGSFLQEDQDAQQ